MDALIVDLPIRMAEEVLIHQVCHSFLGDCQAVATAQERKPGVHRVKG